MAAPPPTPRPLEGVRVLDLSRVLAGPWCTQQLADMGAEIIKIERPGSGDDTRRWAPPWLEGTDESSYFLSANRGERSVARGLTDGFLGRRRANPTYQYTRSGIDAR